VRSKNELISSSVSVCGATSSATYTLERCTLYLQKSRDTGTCVGRGVLETTCFGSFGLLTSYSEAFYDNTDGVYANVGDDRGVGGKASEALPFSWNGVLRVLHTDGIPK
jgi:hypothetical protein